MKTTKFCRALPTLNIISLYVDSVNSKRYLCNAMALASSFWNRPRKYYCSFFSQLGSLVANGVSRPLRSVLMHSFIPFRIMLCEPFQWPNIRYLAWSYWNACKSGAYLASWSFLQAVNGHKSRKWSPWHRRTDRFLPQACSNLWTTSCGLLALANSSPGFWWLELSLLIFERFLVHRRWPTSLKDYGSTMHRFVVLQL